MQDVEPSILYGKHTIGTCAFMAGLPSLQTQSAWSFAQMVQYNAEYLPTNEIIHYMKPSMSGIAEARNHVADHILGDWLFMLDADHWFDPRILARLLRLMKKHDVPIISGLYQFRESPYPAVMFADTGNPQIPFRLLDFDIKQFPKERELIKIGSCGGGCLLIKKEVFVRIKEELGEKPFTVAPPYTSSEDHSFFLRCKKLNIPVHVAPWVECHHIHTIKLKIEDYDNIDINHIPKQEVDIESL